MQMRTPVSGQLARLVGAAWVASASLSVTEAVIMSGLLASGEE
jgi:hypothetical protein